MSRKHLEKLYALTENTCNEQRVLNLIDLIFNDNIPGHQVSISYDKLPECVKNTNGLHKKMFEFCLYYALNMNETKWTLDDAKLIIELTIKNEKLLNLVHVKTSRTLVNLCAEILKSEYPEMYIASTLNMNDLHLLDLYKHKNELNHTKSSDDVWSHDYIN